MLYPKFFNNKKKSLLTLFNGILGKQYSNVDILKIVTSFTNFIISTITYR